MQRPGAELFVEPKHVALLGVSSNAGSVTARPAMFAARYGSGARVTIVKDVPCDELHGLPVASSLAAMPTPPDVAMVLLPADDVVPALNDCVEAGVKGAVVISSGFEGDDSGVGGARRNALREFLAAHPWFRMVGPNCVGVVSPATSTWLNFSSVVLRARPRSGPAGLITQSGAVGNGLLLALQRRGVGVGHWISTGNELDLGALEAAEMLLKRDDCTTLGLFLEGVTDREFRDRLADVISSSGKRVIAMRAAASERGKQAALGHTGRLIGDDRLARAALEEIGVCLVDTLDELTAGLTVTSLSPRRPVTVQPATISVVTVSGATGVLAADEVDRMSNLALAEISDELAASLSESLGDVPALSISNPLDVPVLGNPAVFERTVEQFTRSQEVGATVVIASTLAHDYEALSTSLSSFGAPLVLTSLSPAEDFSPQQCERLALRGVSVVRTPRDAVRALAVWAGQSRPTAQPTVESHVATGRGQQGVLASSALLGEAMSGWLAPVRHVSNLDAALAFHREHGGRGVVLKADGDRIAHRADVGAVVINLRTPEAIVQAYPVVAQVCDALGDRLVVQLMAPPGVELMVSVIRDLEVGLAVLVQAGGTFVDLGGPSVVLTQRREHWVDILSRSAVGALLAGWRGAPAHDQAALLEMLSDLLDAVAASPAIELAECNPVIVHTTASGAGATAVDLLTYTKEMNQ